MQTTERGPQIEAIALTKRVGPDRFAVDRLSFLVEAGELYCLLGAQGAGKTTAINLLVGLTRPTSGHARVAGFDPFVRPVDVKQQVSLVSVRNALYPGMSARQNVEFFTTLGTSRSIARPAIVDAMRQYGIAERHFETPVAALPQESRLSLWLAISFLRDVPIIILDEPSFGLDSRASADLQEYLLDFKRRGKALLLATTDMFLASQVSDRIGILKQGQKIAEQSGSQMLGLSLNELYFDYTGRPPRTESRVRGSEHATGG